MPSNTPPTPRYMFFPRAVGKMFTLSAGKWYVPLRYSILLSILALLVPLLVAIFMTREVAVREEMQYGGQLLSKQSEESIIMALRITQDGYNVLRKAMEREAAPAFAAFLESAAAENGEPGSVDLATIKAGLGERLELYLIDAASGTVVSSTDSRDMGLQLSRFPIFWNNLQSVLQPGVIVTGPVYPEIRGEKPRIFSYMLLPGKNYIFEVGVEANAFTQYLESLDYRYAIDTIVALHPGLERVRIFDQLGYQVTSDRKLRAQKTEWERIRRTLLEKRNLDFPDPDGTGRVRYLFVDLTGKDGWPIYKVVELTVAHGVLEERLKLYSQRQLEVGLLFLGLGILLALFVASRISGPIHRIIDDVNRIAGGDLEHSVSVRSRTELRLLADSIQAMVQRILDQLRDIRRVEEQLTERNAELEKINLELVQEVGARQVFEHKLTKSELILRAFFDAVTESALMVDTDGQIVEINQVACKRLGHSREQLVGRNVAEFFEWDAFERYYEKGMDAVCDKKTVRFEDETGNRILDLICVPIIDAQERVEYLAFYINDVTVKKRKEREVLEYYAYFQQLFENAPLGISIYDAQSRVLRVNKAYEALFICSEEELVGRTTGNLFIPENKTDEALFITRQQLQRQDVRMETVRKRLDGSLVHVSLLSFPIYIHNEHKGSYVIYQDISERKHAEEKLLHHSFHDSLTGFPNRALLLDKLAQALRRSRERRLPLFALVYLDLDRFKVVNDSLGHAAGDQLLLTVAQKLSKLMRPSDTVSRIGGDEFAVLLEALDSPREALHRASTMQKEICQPMKVDGHEIVTSASIGVVVGPVRHDRPESLLRDAEIAMYKAKGMGRNRIKLFQSTMREQAAEILRLENDLRHAVEQNEFLLHYQPLVSVQSGRVVGFEALVRWHHPSRGLIFPDEFVAVAEDSGLILPMGQLVLAEACKQLRVWQNQHPELHELVMAVNLSAKQFLQNDLISWIEQTVLESGLEMKNLKLEITESVVMENAHSARGMLQRLKSLGVQVSIDDFGTGYSSLSYLHQFPIDTLKVDRSFIHRIEGREEDVEIVRAIITLAHNLGMGVVAEGVETVHQARELTAMGCDLFQGYLFSRPLPPEDAEQLLLAEPFAW